MPQRLGYQTLNPEAATPNFVLSNHGSLWLMEPMDDDSREWLREHVSEGQWWGGKLVIEPRYVEGLVEGIRADGYTVGL
jgi:hypothetical protein